MSIDLIAVFWIVITCVKHQQYYFHIVKGFIHWVTWKSLDRYASKCLIKSITSLPSISDLLILGAWLKIFVQLFSYLPISYLLIWRSLRNHFFRGEDRNKLNDEFNGPKKISIPQKLCDRKFWSWKIKSQFSGVRKFENIKIIVLLVNSRIV